MKAIWKYPLVIDDRQIVHVPRGAELLTVQSQGGTPCLWAKVDTEAEPVSVEIVMHGTGHPADDTDGLKYLGTFQIAGLAFVGHCFARELV